MKSSGLALKSLKESLAKDFCTSLQYGEWNRMASKDDKSTFLPFFLNAFCL